MSRAPVCSWQACTRRTRHPSGRCYHHLRATDPRVAVTTDDPALLPVKKPRGPVARFFRNLIPGRVSTRESFVLTKETHTHLGELHRVDGPAVISTDYAGLITEEEWYFEGKRHRTDGPATVSYHLGKISQEIYYENNRITREGGPARISYDEYGNVGQEVWSLDGVTDRIDGPAMIEYRADGTKFAETYYRTGRVHRIDGPAETRNGQSRWTYGDKRADGPAGIGEFLLNETPETMRGEIADSSYAPLLDEGHAPDEIARVLAEGVYTPNGIREVLGGAPAEWVRSFEESAA